VLRFQHPELGRFDLEYTAFQVAEQPSLRLYLYTPADKRTEMKLRETAAQPGSTVLIGGAEGHSDPLFDE
jgi:transcription regulator MmyB-like protein